MLNSILQQGIPLRDSIVLDDEWGLGVRVRIFRMDSTSFDENDTPKMREYLGQITKSARDKVIQDRGMRRGRGGKVISRRSDSGEEPKAPTITVEDLADQIAGHLFRIESLTAEAREAFRVSEDSPVPEIDLLSNAPLGADGEELAFPAGYRTEEDGARVPVWHLTDLEDDDEGVPWGGYFADNPRPTLNNMLALWIWRSSEDADLFGVSEVLEGASTLRPTSDGAPPSSASSESSSGEP